MTIHSARDFQGVSRRLTGIKAVSFDVDGTLLDFDSVMRSSLAEVLKELERLDPEAASELTVGRLIEIRDRVYDELKGKYPSLKDVRREGFLQALRDVGRPDNGLGLHLNELYFRHRYADLPLFDDVRPTLKELAGNHTLGLLSNGNNYASDLGLDDLVEFSVYSEQHGGIEKPDLELFQIALDEAGCAPDELVHVGDSLENDVGGARNVGINAIWLNRTGAEPGAGFNPALATRRWSSKTMRIRSGLFCGSICWMLLSFRAGFCSKTIIPDSEEHPLASSRAVPKAVLRWIRA